MELTPALIVVVISLITQVVLVTAVIISNKNAVAHLKEQGKELRQWLLNLQNTVNDLRVKVGK